MLTAIRALVRNPLIAAFMLLLLIAAFVFLGITDVFRGGGNAAVLVGSERVTVQDVDIAYRRRIEQIQLEDPSFTREQAEQFGIPDQVIRQLTLQAAIQANANVLGLAVSDETLVEQIQTFEAFENPFTGRFDASTYASLLDQAGYRGALGVRRFETEFASDLIRNQYIGAALGGVSVPDAMAQTRSAFESERRDMRALLIPPSLVVVTETPTDEDLVALIAESATIFQRPEVRRFTLVRASPSEYIRDVEVSDEDIRALYDSRLAAGQLSDPATRSFTQWTAPDEAAAQASAEALSAGADGAALTAEFGLGEPAQFSDVEGFEVPDTDIATAVFEMAQGEVRALQSRLGWRVVRVDGAVDPIVPSFNEAYFELSDELALTLAENLMFDRLGVLEDARARGASLEEAATEAELPIERFDWVARNGATPTNQAAQTLLRDVEILPVVFDLPLSFDSDLESYGENGYFLVRVDEIQEAALPELDEVREDAEAIWQLRETDNALQDQVDGVIARLEAGETLDAISADLEGSRVEITSLSRGQNAGPFSEALVAQAFGAEVGQPFATRAADVRVRAVVLVDRIHPPQDTPIAPDLRSAMREELTNDLASALEIALLNEYEVRADQRLIDAGLGRTELNPLQ